MTIQEYEAWLNQAATGDRLPYHFGELSRDRGKYGANMEWLANEPLHSLADRIYDDAMAGLVELTQYGTGCIPEGVDPVITDVARYVYIAQRSSKEL